MTISKETEDKLQALRKELRQFPNENKPVIEQLVKSLVDEGTYFITPEMKRTGDSPLKMAKTRGVYWFNWDYGVSECEKCGDDIRDLEKGPPCTKSVYIKRLGVDGGELICLKCSDKMHERSK